MPLNDLIGIPYVRLVHLIGMWCFIIFAMIHVYLSILSGNVSRDRHHLLHVQRRTMAAQGRQFQMVRTPPPSP